MKKLAFMFVAFAAISFASCGNKTSQAEVATDSMDVAIEEEEVVDVDTAVVDVDTAAVDTAAVPDAQ